VPLSNSERASRVGPYPYYGATGVFGRVDDYLFDETLVLVGEDGSVVNDDGSPVTQYIWGKCWINNHAHVLTGSDLSTELLYLALGRSDVRPIVTGAVQAKVSMGNLKGLHLSIPNRSECDRIEADIQSLFALYRLRTEEIDMLASLRDTLLPELLSGRIPVKARQEEHE
jgi:type I restriction enzyme S subunit